MANVLEIPLSGKILTGLVVILILLGLIMLSSAGVVEGQYRFDAPYHFVWHQVLFGVLPGLIIFYVLSRINYAHWRRLALPILFSALLLTALVFAPGIGLTLKGASRWLDLGSITVQPAEALKLGLTIYLAAWFSGRKQRRGAHAHALAPFLIILSFVAVLLIMQPDFGTLGLIIIIALSLYFFSGGKIKHLAILFLVCALALGSLSIISPYRFDRIKTFLDPTSDTLGSSYHINQAFIGIGSGGIFGVGFGQSQQKHAFLPEVVGDSIFAVLVEELGLAGGVFLIFLFLALFFTMLYIAKNSVDEFGKLFVLGMIVWVVGQAFVNIAAISGIIPLTGLPLPFISFGSSSLVAILAGMGICVSITRYS